MMKDKSAEEREKLSQKILDLEIKEDEFKSLNQKYEDTLEHFYSQIHHLSQRQELLLQETMVHHNNHHRRDWEANQELKQRLNRYVDQSYTELEDVRRRFRRENDKQRDQLTEERNKLPWD
ncbi:cingulin [Streptococcus sp.]|uniref:cingulin n=1 Tax=Streptococcus sp. TaxID=1306 RepID=UPI0035A16F9A